MCDVLNCDGCKWLDRVRSKEAGHGYCCRVVRSELWKETRLVSGPDAAPSPKVRRHDMERCELYESGDFATRYGLKTSICEANFAGFLQIRRLKD